MANIGDLQNNFVSLSKLEEPLWAAFKTAEKESKLPTFDIKRLHACSWPLYKAKQLPWYFYPALPLILMIFAYILSAYFLIDSILQDHRNWLSATLSVILLMVCVEWMRRAYKCFQAAYTESQLKNSDFSVNAFGIKNVSLLLYFFLKDVKGNGIKKDDLGSVAKIVKSACELEDISFGVADYVKRLFFGAGFSALYLYYSYKEEVDSILDKMIKKNILVTYGVLIILFSYVFYVAYIVIVESTLKKKQKKRYLLALNLIHESWVK